MGRGWFASFRGLTPTAVICRPYGAPIYRSIDNALPLHSSSPNPRRGYRSIDNAHPTAHPNPRRGYRSIDNAHPPPQSKSP
ncbi:MAG: hypothetical protein IJR26_11800 [Bacteroidales bacterium]|nr:hypothetical protein [Bacteroidales bacterium]